MLTVLVSVEALYIIRRPAELRLEMRRRFSTRKMNHDKKTAGVVTLKAVAEHVGLSAGTVSAVLNDAPSGRHIPQGTRERILAAARKLNYRPNFFARSLRKRRTFTIGVIAHEIGDGYGSTVIAGIESGVRQRDYFFLTGIHHKDPELFDRYSRMLLQRGAEGIICIDFSLTHPLPVPAVCVPGHTRREGVTNIVLDQQYAAELALKHLVDRGHKQIAILRGHAQSPDSEYRWEAVNNTAKRLGLQFDPELVLQIDSMETTPNLGYPYGKQLLAKKRPFTALLAYNDISAVGAIRAFQEAGLRVPEDISVIGFDDIPAAEFNSPSLTTVRQPLRRMGEIAVEALIGRIEDDSEAGEIAVQPEIVPRESTGPAPHRS